MVAYDNFISMYNDTWINYLSLSVWPTYIDMNNYCPELHISNIIHKSREWNVTRLAQVFSTKLIHLIVVIHILFFIFQAFN